MKNNLIFSHCWCGLVSSVVMQIASYTTLHIWEHVTWTFELANNIQFNKPNETIVADILHSPTKFQIKFNDGLEFGIGWTNRLIARAVSRQTKTYIEHHIQCVQYNIANAFTLKSEYPGEARLNKTTTHKNKTTHIRTKNPGWWSIVK